MGNQTRSDFFMVRVNVAFMYIVASSCPVIQLCLNLFLVSESDQIKKKRLDKMVSLKIR